LSGIFDLYGFLSVLLHTLELVAQSVLIGSVAFLWIAAVPMQRRMGAPALLASTLRVAQVSAWILAVVALVATLLEVTVLSAMLQISIAEAASARFALMGAVKAIAAALAAIAARPSADASPTPSWRLPGLALCVVVMFAAALATTHATARPMFESMLLIATGMHRSGAALWLGGLPCFYRALRIVEGDRAARAWLGKRYSAISITGVGLILVGATVLAVTLIGSWGAFYGTPYGAMAATKSTLLAVLLLVGLGNFLAVRRFSAGDAGITRVRRFVEIEMAFGVAVLALAASMTSAPPGVDLADDRVTLDELAQRLTPKPPQLETPDASSLAIASLQGRLDEEAARAGVDSRARTFIPGSGEPAPRNAYDIAWSEYNHHWSGVIVLLIGVFALLERTGRAPWARHWPLLFLGLAVFILVRADPEVWPLGRIGLIESLRDPEVVQHRLFAILTIAFAGFEWRVRTGRFQSRDPALVFPILMIAGGILLFAHTHAISDVKDQVLIEWSHLPLGVFAVTGGAARWLQLRAAHREARWAGWVWPVCLVLTGIMLLNYREA
jgi:putative copper resistance protein D